MTATTKPDKQVVRDHMAQRAKDESPPPTPEQIRRELGWRLIPENGSAPEEIE